MIPEKFKVLKSFCLLAVFALSIAIQQVQAQSSCTSMGWATYNGQSASSITGGGSATPIQVTTFSQLKSAAESSSAAVIYVMNDMGAGYVGTTGDVLNVKSNKTIVGFKPNITVKCSWQINGVSNVIIKNLICRGPGNSNSNQNWDCVNIQGSKQIWFDHCTVMEGEDGNFDVVKGSDNVTATFCKFTYVTNGSHNLSNLIGSSDDEPVSHGKLNVTYAYCWWDNVDQRTPRTRYGKIHVLNCYYNDCGQGPHSGFMSNVRVEGCFFESNVGTPIGMTSPGGQSGCFAINCNRGTTQTDGYSTVFVPPYQYQVQPNSSVKAMVTDAGCGAGPTLDSPTDCGCGTTPVNTPPTVSITSPANNATFTAPASITINANAADANGTVSSVAFYNGSTLLGTDASSPYSFSWTNVAAGTYTITAKATDNGGAVTTSTAITVVVNPSGQVPTVSITSPANNAAFTAPASITVNATAADADGTISSVAFYNEAVLLGTDASAPYSYSWTNVAAGTYTLTARATDNSGAVTTSSPITIVVNGVPGTDVTIQAETACSVDGVLIETDQPGYNGTGFVNTDNAAGATVTWSVNSPSGQMVNLTFRFANGGTVNRDMSLSVNGTVQIPVVSFPSTGSFTTWTTANVSITLARGTNKILMTALTSGGGPNIDELTYNSQGISSGSCGQVPVVSITSPSNGTTFTAPASVTINATASDADGTISSVAFYNGSTLLGTDASSPYSFTWTNAASGTYSITAVATDNDGGVTTSSPVTVTIGTSTGIFGSSYGTFTQVYPNPSLETFIVKPSNEIKSLSVINMYGVEVINMQDLQAGNQIEIGEHLAEGTYIMHIKYISGNIEVARLVKMK